MQLGILEIMAQGDRTEQFAKFIADRKNATRSKDSERTITMQQWRELIPCSNQSSVVRAIPGNMTTEAWVKEQQSICLLPTTETSFSPSPRTTQSSEPLRTEETSRQEGSSVTLRLQESSETSRQEGSSVTLIPSVSSEPLRQQEPSDTIVPTAPSVTLRQQEPSEPLRQQEPSEPLRQQEPSEPLRQQEPSEIMVQAVPSEIMVQASSSVTLRQQESSDTMVQASPSGIEDTSIQSSSTDPSASVTTIDPSVTLRTTEHSGTSEVKPEETVRYTESIRTPELESTIVHEACVPSEYQSTELMVYDLDQLDYLIDSDLIVSPADRYTIYCESGCIKITSVGSSSDLSVANMISLTGIIDVLDDRILLSHSQLIFNAPSYGIDLVSSGTCIISIYNGDVRIRRIRVHEDDPLKLSIIKVPVCTKILVEQGQLELMQLIFSISSTLELSRLNFYPIVPLVPSCLPGLLGSLACKNFRYSVHGEHKNLVIKVTQNDRGPLILNVIPDPIRISVLRGSKVLGCINRQWIPGDVLFESSSCPSETIILMELPVQCSMMYVEYNAERLYYV